jgi:hypothetical protein
MSARRIVVTTPPFRSDRPVSEPTLRGSGTWETLERGLIRSGQRDANQEEKPAELQREQD